MHCLILGEKTMAADIKAEAVVFDCPRDATNAGIGFQTGDLLSPFGEFVSGSQSDGTVSDDNDGRDCRIRSGHEVHIH